MKKALVPLFILSLALNANASEYTQNNTKPCSQGEITMLCDSNGAPITGSFKHYHKNGNLFLEINYKDGKKEGLAKHYHENGKLKTKVNYKDGRFDGPGKFYFENGNLELEENYKQSKRIGLSKFYYKNGNLEAEVNFKDGEADGLSKFYFENGELRGEINFKDGEAISGNFYDIYGREIKLTNAHLHYISKYLK